MKLIILFLISSLSLADAILTVDRAEKKFRIDSSSNNIPTSADATAGSLAVSSMGSVQHLQICSEAATRIRYSWGSTSAPASTAYQGILPAAAASSFVCASLDDVQLSGNLYLWSDGSAISSGIVYGSAW